MALGHLPSDEMAKMQQEMMAREVDEDVQKQRLQNLWNKYRFVILGAVLALLLVTIGMEVHRSTQIRSSLEESDLFENAVVASHSGDKEKALQLLTDLSKDGDTGYGYLAELKMAGILFEQNKAPEALAVLKKVMDNRWAPDELRAVATLSYVGHQVDTGNGSELQKELAPLLKKGNGFYGSAAELSAILLLKEGNKEAAVKLLQEAVNNNLASEVTKQHLISMLSIIEK